MATHHIRRRTTPVFRAPTVAHSADDARTAWTSFDPEDRVLVHEAGKAPFEAVIDVLTYDRTVVWVLPRTVGSRRAFHYSDDVHIVVLIGR